MRPEMLYPWEFTVKQELHAVTFDVATYNQLNNHPGRK
jgi:hypothetical protein